MYKGTNPIALKSQQWLINSLLSLMKEQAYSHITIQAICKNADLSRQTFYNFFETKDDILRCYIHNIYDNQFKQFAVTPTMQETVEAIAQIINENKEILFNMIENNLESIITDEMVKCVGMFAERFILKSDDSDTFYYKVVLFSGALAHMLVYWLRQDNPISTEELIMLLTDFLSGNLYEFGVQ